MKINRRSWRHSVFIMLLVFVISMIIFFAGVFIHFYQQKRTSYRAENQQAVEL